MLDTILRSEDLLQPAVLVPAGAALLGLLLLAVGLLRRPSRATGRRGGSAPAGDDDTDPELKELRKSMQALQTEHKHLSTFLVTLPDFARQLNSTVEKRRIPELLVGCTERLFDAQQILVFLTSHEGRHLTLSAAKGIPEGQRTRNSIPFGRGRAGWVALHQIAMDESDFGQKSRAGRDDMDAGIPGALRFDLGAPMVSKDQTLGVIAVAGMAYRPRNEKNMLKMIADLGSIAIQNAILFNKIQESANSDGLTGLYNKRHFLTRLADEILRAEKEQKPLSLFLFDIDHFKNYNDTNGHVAGDEALRITGRLMRETLREDDMPARYGGEEFVVLLPGTDKKGAAVVAEKIRRVMEAHAYPNEQAQPGGRVTISGGVATYPSDAVNTGDLIRCADQALYQGKRAGRNRVCLYEPRYLSDETSTTLQSVQGGGHGS